MIDVVGLMLPGWGARERARITRERIRALNNQLRILMRETYDFGAKHKPKPYEGMETVAADLKQLFSDWVKWFQQALEQPDEAYETAAIPTKLDQFAERYAHVRRRVVRRLKLRGKHTKTVPAKAIQKVTEPGVLEGLIQNPTQSLTLIAIGAAMILFYFSRKE